MAEIDEVQVRRFGSEGAEVAVFEFEGRLREVMIANLRAGYLATGTYASDGRTVSSHGMLSLIAAGSATAGTIGSAAFSSSLFMATANPATLTQIGAGVGSAQMGVGGIVAQAPFLAVPSALPVVAPIMAMQVLNAVMMLQQFQNVDRKLTAIKSTLDEAIGRSEATHAGELIAASSVLDDVYRQYELEGSFSTDMLLRLAIAEHEVRRLSERFAYLVDAHSISDVDDLAGIERNNFDAHSAMLASFLDLRVAYLRVRVDMQENPRSVAGSVDRLRKTIGADVELWQRLLSRSESIRTTIGEREAAMKDLNWAERFLPEFAGGRGAAAERKLDALRQAYVKTLESELAITKGFDSLIESATQTLHELEKPAPSQPSPTLVYWRDEDGEHSFTSEALRLS